tara:strand:+ start:275 stop:736 length:462 start_codon:yes stop_codon:yes gene_type:complete
MTKNKEAYNKSVHFLKLFKEGYFKKHPNQLELQNLKKELISFVKLEDFLALLKTRKFREEKAKIDWGKWEKVNKEYKQRCSEMSDSKLIKAFNREVGCSGWGTHRSYYLGNLSREINIRFDTSEIQTFNNDGSYAATSYANKIYLKNKKIYKI